MTATAFAVLLVAVVVTLTVALAVHRFTYTSAAFWAFVVGAIAAWVLIVWPVLAFLEAS